MKKIIFLLSTRQFFSRRFSQKKENKKILSAVVCDLFLRISARKYFLSCTKIFLTSMFTLLFSGYCSSNLQVPQEWIQRYNGPRNSNDYASSMAIDNAKNVIITGYIIGIDGTLCNYATVKYNSSGIKQWSQIYNSQGNRNDISNSSAVDDSGNVYVTGSNYTTIKYNSSGVQQWLKVYTGADSSEAFCIGVDGSGYVYVTGSIFVNGVSDFATIKYNPDGNEQWVKLYNGSGDLNDDAKSLAVDNSGNVYVTGKSYGGSGTVNDFVTIKYNAAGIVQWINRYNGAESLNDEAKFIKVDGSGNVYVTGTSSSSFSNSSYTTIKCNSNGNSLWVKKYNGIGYGSNDAFSLGIDGAGNVYVTGCSFGDSAFDDYATIKYNSSGDEQWVKRYNGPESNIDKANSITLDDSGNAYVTGFSKGSLFFSDYDYATIKYNPSGVEQWIQRYNGTGNENDRANSIAVDGLGNVYVSGSSYGGITKNDFAVIKYSQYKTPPSNLFYNSADNSLRWFRSNPYPVNYIVMKKNTDENSSWITTADSGGVIAAQDSYYSIRTSGFKYYKVGAVFSDGDTLFTDSIFVKRGYVLRKIENNNVVAFNPVHDAFVNVQNSSTHLWPEEWWIRFNYNDVSEYESSYFSGEPSDKFVDWNLFAKIFGEDKVFLNSRLKIYRPEYVLRWLLTNNEFNGSCAGISMTTILSFYNNPEYLSKFPVMNNIVPGEYLIDHISLNVFNYLQKTQSFPGINYLPEDGSQQTAMNVLSKLIEIFSNTDVPLNYYLTLTGKSINHALVPYAVEQSTRDRQNGIYYIYVIDSNFPNQNSFIILDSISNRWSYAGLNQTFQPIGIALRGPITSVLNIKSVESKSDSFIDTVSYFTSSVTGSVFVIEGNDTIAGYNSSDTSIISFRNCITESTDGILRSPLGYNLTNFNKKFIFTNNTSETKAKLFYNPVDGKYFGLERKDIASRTESEVVYPTDSNYKYLNPDNVTKKINLITIAANDTNSKYCGINDMPARHNDTITLSLENIYTVLRNSGGPKSYILKLSYSSKTTFDEFNGTPVEISANSTHKIRPVWEQLVTTAVTILIDNGNDGSYDDSVSVTPSPVLRLTVFIQGFYDVNSNSMIPDTLTVYLRNATSPFVKIDSSKSFLSPSGTGTFSFPNASNKIDYYLQLNHRNSIETWSAIPQRFINSSMIFNLSDTIEKSYGSNMKEVDEFPIVFALYSGDVNQDGFIDLTDLVLVYNDASNFISGYVLTDLNGDNQTDLTDIIIVNNNSKNFVRAIRP